MIDKIKEINKKIEDLYDPSNGLLNHEIQSLIAERTQIQEQCLHNNITAERRPNGKQQCNDCGKILKRGD